MLEVLKVLTLCAIRSIMSIQDERKETSDMNPEYLDGGAFDPADCDDDDYMIATFDIDDED